MIIRAVWSSGRTKALVSSLLLFTVECLCQKSLHSPHVRSFSCHFEGISLRGKEGGQSFFSLSQKPPRSLPKNMLKPLRKCQLQRLSYLYLSMYFLLQFLSCYSLVHSFFFLFIYLFFFNIWLCWVFIAAASGFPVCSLQAPEHTGLGVAVCGPLSRCGAQAQLPCSLWDLSSPTRDRTCVPCIGRWILNLWTTREVPFLSFLKNSPCGLVFLQS